MREYMGVFVAGLIEGTGRQHFAHPRRCFLDRPAADDFLLGQASPLGQFDQSHHHVVQGVQAKGV
jgi:hypothetical protein